MKKPFHKLPLILIPEELSDRASRLWPDLLYIDKNVLRKRKKRLDRVTVPRDDRRGLCPDMTDTKGENETAQGALFTLLNRLHEI